MEEHYGAGFVAAPVVSGCVLLVELHYISFEITVVTTAIDIPQTVITLV